MMHAFPGDAEEDAPRLYKLVSERFRESPPQVKFSQLADFIVTVRPQFEKPLKPYYRPITDISQLLSVKHVYFGPEKVANIAVAGYSMRNGELYVLFALEGTAILLAARIGRLLTFITQGKLMYDDEVVKAVTEESLKHADNFECTSLREFLRTGRRTSPPGLERELVNTPSFSTIMNVQAVSLDSDELQRVHYSGWFWKDMHLYILFQVDDVDRFIFLSEPYETVLDLIRERVFYEPGFVADKEFNAYVEPVAARRGPSFGGGPKRRRSKRGSQKSKSPRRRPASRKSKSKSKRR